MQQTEEQSNCHRRHLYQLCSLFLLKLIATTSQYTDFHSIIIYSKTELKYLHSSIKEKEEKSDQAGLNRRPLNLQSNALPLSYSRSKSKPIISLMIAHLIQTPHTMSSKEELYSVLSEKIVKLHDEMLRFTTQAQKTQRTIATAWDVTCLYADMQGSSNLCNQLGSKMQTICLQNRIPLVPHSPYSQQ